MTGQEPAHSFGEAMFGQVQLGDQRRTRRLVQLADQLCKHPGGTLPEKLKSPKDLKALYRLCERDEVTHAALLQSVRQAVLAELDNHDDIVLILHDATELDYSTRKSLSGQLGRVGQGFKRGFLCHNSLAVKPGGREVVGLVNQILHRRPQVAKKESLPQRRQRKSRESRLWLLGTAGLPGDSRLVDVADRGGDTFEFLQHEIHSGRRFVVRAHHPRKVSAERGAARATTTPLHAYARSLPALGGRTTPVTAQPRKGSRPARPARQAQLLVSAAAVEVHPPHAKRGEHSREPLPLWIVRVWEPHPPQDAAGIEWLLLTNEPINTLADADRVIGWYQTRWVIEEFHKAMKTGCAVENLQFTDTDRLEPMIALLSTVATTLLNLRAASELPDARTRSANTVIDQAYVAVLSAWRFGKIRNLTVHEFFFALARLGGHQNRRGDKRPGWLILWRGWTTLQAMLEGVETTHRYKCG